MTNTLFSISSMIVSPDLYILQITFTGIELSILYVVVLDNGMLSFIFFFVINILCISPVKYFSSGFDNNLSFSDEDPILMESQDFADIYRLPFLILSKF